MFISKLIRTVENYDPLGIFLVHGIKIVYILMILFAFNGLLDIPNSYFYFFYVPLTAMTAEIQGTNLPERYTFFIGVTLGTIAIIMMFNLLFPIPMLFLFCAFVITFLLYKHILKTPNQLFWVPIMLSLVSYSLNYRVVNGSPWAILNNGITTLIAMFIILGALVLFPLSFHYRIWLRTLHKVVDLCLKNFLVLQSGQATVTDIPAYIVNLRIYANMLPYKFPTYSILKITLLIHELYLMSCVSETPVPIFTQKQFQDIVCYLRQLLTAIEHEETCIVIEDHDNMVQKIMQSWNHCVTHI